MHSYAILNVLIKWNNLLLTRAKQEETIYIGEDDCNEVSEIETPKQGQHHKKKAIGEMDAKRQRKKNKAQDSAPPQWNAEIRDRMDAKHSMSSNISSVDCGAKFE